MLSEATSTHIYCPDISLYFHTSKSICVVCIRSQRRLPPEQWTGHGEPPVLLMVAKQQRRLKILPRPSGSPSLYIHASGSDVLTCTDSDIATISITPSLLAPTRQWGRHVCSVLAVRPASMPLLLRRLLLRLRLLLLTVITTVALPQRAIMAAGVCVVADRDHRGCVARRD